MTIRFSEDMRRAGKWLEEKLREHWLDASKENTQPYETLYNRLVQGKERKESKFAENLFVAENFL